jgi:hypothetical protein
VKIDVAYVAANAPIMNEQLQKSRVRRARLLEAALGTQTLTAAELARFHSDAARPRNRDLSSSATRSATIASPFWLQ